MIKDNDLIAILQNEIDILKATNQSLDNENRLLRQSITDLDLISGKVENLKLSDTLPEIIYKYSNLRGAIYWSPAVNSVLGFSPDYFIQNPLAWHDSIHPEDISYVDEAIKNFRSSGGYDLEYRIRNKGGEWLWFRDKSIFKVEIENEIIVIGLASDITEIKRKDTILKLTEESILKNEKRYQTIIETSFDGFWVVDMTGKIIEVNNSYIKSSGYTKEEILNKSIDDFNIIEDKERFNSRVKQILQKGQGVFITQHRKKDGSRWHLEVNVTYSNLDNGIFFVFLKDITEIRRAELLLIENEEKYHALLKSSRDAIIINENGTITFTNEAALNLFGARHQEQLIGKPMLDLYHPDCIDFFKKRIDNVLKENLNVPPAEEKIIRFDGKIIDVEVTASPFSYKGRKAIFVLLKDISDRKFAELEKEVTIKLLSAINKSSEITDLVFESNKIFQEFSSCESAGIRYRQDSDFPYLVTSGFSERFILKENFLCSRDLNNKIINDSQGSPVLECMCGNIIQGRYDKSQPFFTESGSFWTNSTTDLLNSTIEGDRQSRTRNRCNGEGYESVALIPLRLGNEVIGLVQLNDHRRNMFTREMILCLEKLASFLSGAFAHINSQQLLNESELRHRRISSLISNIAYSCKKKNNSYKFDWIAGSSYKTFGYSIDEMYDLGCWKSLVIKEDQPIFVKNILELQPGCKSSCDLRTITREGELKWINSIAECEAGEKDSKATIYGGIIDITEQKLASEALRISRENLEEAQQIGKIGSWKYNILNDRVKCSSEALKIFNISTESDELSWHDLFSDVHTKDCTELFDTMNRSMIAGTPFSFECRINHNNQETVWALITGRLIYDSNDEVSGLKGTIQDITDRKSAIMALNHSHDLMRYVIEHNPGAVAVHDREMKYIYVSQRYLSEYNVAERDIIGKGHYEIFPDLPQKWRDAHQEALKGNIVKKDDDIYEREDGTIEWKRWECRPWYEANNDIGGIIVYTEVITERKRMEIALKQSEAQLMSIFNNAPVIMILLNEKTEVLKMNRFIMESSGRNSEKMTGLKPGNVMKCIYSVNSNGGCGFNEKCRYCILRSTVLNTLKTGIEYYKVEGEMLIKDEDQAKIHTILISTSVIATIPEKQVLVTIDDISLRKRMERELIAARDKAEESDNLKSAFLSNISHEIRTPMNGIMGFSEMLEKPGLSDEKRKQFSSLISDGCKQLLTIVNDVIDISMIDTAQVSIISSEFSINDLVHDIFLDFRSAANNKNISLYLKKPLSDDRAIIKSDRERLKQILSNLLSNAIKFTKQGSVEFGYVTKLGMIEFYVKDTGIGMRKELQNVIFERFRQAEISDTRNYGGTGLGLSISKALIELLGGKIWLESKPDEGTTFFFTIPMVSTEKNTSMNTMESTGSESVEVLVAEDDDLNYLFLEEVLKGMKYITHHARNGLEAVNIFKKNPSIKLILMDIKMPVMDGFESARILKGLNPLIPIIAQTAYSINESTDERRNFDAFISKPINKHNLDELISTYIRK